MARSEALYWSSLPKLLPCLLILQFPKGLGVDLEDSQTKACEAPVRKVAPLGSSWPYILFGKSSLREKSNFLLSLLVNLLEKLKYS